MPTITKTYRFTPPMYEGDGDVGCATADLLTVSGSTVTPTTHTPTANEVDANFVIPANVSGTTGGNFTVLSVGGGAYTLDGSAGTGTAGGGGDGIWRIGGHLPFWAQWACTQPYTAAHIPINGLPGFGADLLYDATDGSDFSGSSQPGCLSCRFQLTSGKTSNWSGDAYSPHGSDPTEIKLTWEHLGVPSGATVQSVSGRCRAQNLATGTGQDVLFLLTLDNDSLVSFATLANANVHPATTWTTYAFGPTTVTGAQAASNAIIVLHLNLQTSSSVAVDYTFYIDTIEIDVTYSSPAPPVTEPARSQGVGLGRAMLKSAVAARSFGLGLARTLLTSRGSVRSQGIGQARAQASNSTPPVDIIGGSGRVGLMPIEFDLSGPLVVGADVAFELYFCGLANASAVASAAYGTPTYFVFDNPVANTDYHQTQTPVDLNGAAPGTQLFLRLRRIGNDPLDTSDANCLWTTLVLEYDGSETTT